MAKLRLEVSLDSDALVQEATFELDRIFKKVVANYSTLKDPNWGTMNLFDSNGANVGSCTLQEEA